MLIISLQHVPKAKDTRFHNLRLLNFETEAESWSGGRGQRVPRPRPRPRPEVTRPAETEAEAKILASRLVGPRGFNIFDRGMVIFLSTM